MTDRFGPMPRWKPEKFCTTCRNTGYVVLRDQADTINVTGKRCPHCPAPPPLSRNHGSVPPDDAPSFLIAGITVGIGLALLLCVLFVAAYVRGHS